MSTLTGLSAFGRLNSGNGLYTGIGSGSGLPRRLGDTLPTDLDAPMTLEDQKRVSFRDLMLGGIQEVNMMQQNADKAVETLMTGGEIGTAEVLTAVQKADIAFKMMMQMRNKLVGAFQEIQNIRV
ncbi:MAG: flagellar hook-basal body complex protein FliE [Thermoguttaceae bacterium]